MNKFEYYSTSEAAKKLGVTKNTIIRHIQSGNLEGKKVLGRWKVTKLSVNRLM